MEADTHTFPCSACGANLAYEPGAERLSCKFCGTEQPIPERREVIEEHDLYTALLSAPKVKADKLAEGATEVRCEGCGAVSVLTKTADRCAFCDSPVVRMEEDDAIHKPESVLPFAIERRAAQESFRSWIRSRWFAPGDLLQRAQSGAIEGVYLPYWTFDSTAFGIYRGERGEYYYEEETYEDSDGEIQTREVRRTEWYPVSGKVCHEFDDMLVCATKSLPQSLTEKLEPWDLEELRPFDPSYLAGFQAERYNIPLEEGWEIAQGRMRAVLERDVKEDIGGDRQRVHELVVRHRFVSFKHTLLPLWISSYRYNGKVYRVIVNARTGAVSGDRPYSVIKITLFVLAILMVLAFFFGGFTCCASISQMVSGS